MDYPLDLRFRLISLGPQINVLDATGRSVAYVKQKAFRLKEDVEVHTDDTRQTLLWRIKADRIIDWSAAYRMTDASGALLGTLRRKGGRSLWRATYVITDANEQAIGGIHEKDPWTKVLDGLLSIVPILGDLSGYFLNPSYVLSRGDEPVLEIRKRPAFFEGRFIIEKLGTVDPRSEALYLASLLMMVLLERGRG
ncbi:MAG: hypothetical protein M3O80_00655 [Chloroflexota bacterium]|nr:hypothetical protein [Chloroflexota bacterium]